ncbi:hypothetical protein EV702DRAFT_271533 [Suillus placidus]|uniref:DUF6533 domain-containing protein n=1 Tax=Suillus placidus TaxID=48579 RepID=A0A9P6ZUZ7_9AGAM|nr:hypothetical protein EV702DRAFT_271533 [Suillus placidus]
MDIIQAQQLLILSYYAILVPNTILIYDHMVTLAEEISSIWCRPKALSALLFLLNRYVALLGNVYGLIGNFLPTSVELSDIHAIETSARFFTSMYRLRKRLLAFLVVIILAFVGGASTETFGHYPTTVTDLPGGCYQTYTAEATFRLGVAWVALSVYELLIFVLTVSKIFKIRGLLRLSLIRSRRNIVVVMFQDGAMYFGAMTLFNIPNILTYYCGPDVTRGTLSTFTSCMSVILISRLMLNLHKSIDAGILSSPTQDDVDDLPILTTRLEVQSTNSSHYW